MLNGERKEKTFLPRGFAGTKFVSVVFFCFFFIKDKGT